MYSAKDKYGYREDKDYFRKLVNYEKAEDYNGEWDDTVKELLLFEQRTNLPSRIERLKEMIEDAEKESIMQEEALAFLYKYR